MRTIGFLCVLVFAGPAGAQSTFSVFAAPGQTRIASPSTNSSNFGLGLEFERILSGGQDLPGAFGVNVQAEGIIKATGQASGSVGITSIDGAWHPKQWGKADFFVLGGYSVVFRDFGVSGFNFGAGLNYWLSDRIAFHLEAREQRASVPIEPETHGGPKTQYWGIGMGFTVGHQPGH